jgi:flagella basal body P-ring formation protein FlgA
VRIPTEALNVGMALAIKSKFLSVAAYPVTAQAAIKLYQQKDFIVTTENYQLKYVLEHDLTPKMQARITIIEGTTPVRTVRLPFTVGVFAPVVHVRQAYCAGTQVTADMLYLKEENIIDRLSSVLFSLDTFTGQQLVNSVRQDQVLQRWMLRRKPDVVLGDQITVILKTEDIELRVAAEVLQSGFIGDKIRVRLRPTKKVVSVRIVAPGEYEVQW